MICDWWIPIRFECSVLLNIRVCVVLKRAVSFPALCLVNWEDLCFDVLLCDVNFSCLSSKVSVPSY